MTDTGPHASPRAASVLIVDDSSANLRLLYRILREQGIEARPLSEARLAVASAKADPPDVILLDIDMPDMNGFEVCAALKADEAVKSIPVIFISGLSETANIVKGLSVGGADYVIKPFQPEEVTARIRTQLRILSLQRQLAAHNEQLEREVAERTRDLALANQRLQELSRIKDDFLRMIAHEIRTPANGLLGMSDLIVELCDPAGEIANYRQHYEVSKARLLNLIEDSALIAEVTRTAERGDENGVSFATILRELEGHLADIRITSEHAADLDAIFIRDDRALLLRALETLVLMATAFSTQKRAVRLRLSVDEGALRLRFALDAFRMSAAAAANFFEMESLTRSASEAEYLGLSPVVAHKIIGALGGALRLVKEIPQDGPPGRHEGHGYLEAVLPVCQCRRVPRGGAIAAE